MLKYEEAWQIVKVNKMKNFIEIFILHLYDVITGYLADNDDTSKCKLFNEDVTHKYTY